MLTTRIYPPAYLPLRRSALSCSSLRSFGSSLRRHIPAELRASLPQENAAKGTEGPHSQDTLVGKTTDISNRPQIHGDWVLFHPVYTPEELNAVKVLHHDTKTWSDRFALLFVKALRSGFDIVSRYKHKPIPENAKSMSVQELRKSRVIMDDKQWLSRILFLESIAGVPGMVGAMARHLMSLRLMKRDAGWIHTLLEEAENERIHLMTFMTLKKPSIWFRAMVLGAQGVFFNAFFFSYLISPVTCHRFVGFLEEEAVITYTRVIEEIKAGRLPEWENMDAPPIAKDYWRLPSNAKMIDVIYAVRADEATHRFCNHTLANLQPRKDVNPFAIREPNMHVKGVMSGFTRDESEHYVKESHRLMKESESKQ